ncbi:MAG TPA: CHRD domain-containing protein [Solirubrobacteraceae bacterium]|jgi:hypothetical protein
MRRILAIALAAIAVLAVPALGAGSKFSATLNGKSETPKSNSKATGSATVTISGKSLKYTLKASGLTGGAQAAHIHYGKPGQAGPVIFVICAKPCSLPKSGTLTSKAFTKAPAVKTFAAALKAIRAGRTYVNIHTKKHPAGEIRGQLK